MRAQQLSISFPKVKRRGGARLGAGRKPAPAQQRRTPHRARALCLNDQMQVIVLHGVVRDSKLRAAAVANRAHHCARDVLAAQ